MTAGAVLGQLRRFLLLLSVMLFVGALIELWLVGHTEDTIQWLAFGLAGLGILAALGRVLRSNRVTLLILRISMLVVILGSILGVYEHLYGNLEFEREIQPGAPTSVLLSKAIKGGNPLLAPGILAIAATLALSATYRHDITGNAHET